ncbi:MAG: YjbE family putative metal transport protein [Burkholderia sp.]|nr:YjbE family putative metal transport protein [Burkholderia sp.]
MLDSSTLFHWSAIFQIIMVDIVLGGDNAILISLTCRNLPSKQRLYGMIFGAAGAVFMRIILITFAITLLDIPLLKFFGGILLLLIGIKLIVPFKRTKKISNKPYKELWSAVKTIIVADAIMSFDNVIAIAGIAEQAELYYRIKLIAFGLVVSIPFIIGGSMFMLKLFDIFPNIVFFGAGLIGWIGGGLIVRDPVANLLSILETQSVIYYTASAIGAVFVLILGYILRHFRKYKH